MEVTNECINRKTCFTKKCTLCLHGNLDKKIGKTDEPKIVIIPNLKIEYSHRLVFPSGFSKHSYVHDKVLWQSAIE